MALDVHAVRPGPMVGLALAVCLALSVTACGSSTSSTGAPGQTASTPPAASGASSGPSTPSKGVAKIGVLAPMTGPLAGDAEDYIAGSTLAVEQINAAGGIAGYSLEMVSYDTEDGRPDAVASAVHRLLGDDGVNGAVSGLASGNASELDLLADAQMPYTTSANPAQYAEIVAKDPSRYSTYWSYVPEYVGYETDLPKLLEGLISAGRWTPKYNKTVHITTSENDFSNRIANGLAKNFTAAGWTVSGRETVPFGPVNDWRSIIAKIRANPPDLVVNTDYQPANTATFLTQFLENPTQSLLFIQYGPATPEFVDLTKDASNGVLYNLIGAPLPGSDRTKQFETSFKKRFNREPGLYAYHLWEQVQLYAEALGTVGDATNRAAVGAEIGKIKKDIIAGHLEFDQVTHLAKYGDAYIPTTFYQLRDNGTRILIAPPKYAGGEFMTPPWLK